MTNGLIAPHGGELIINMAGESERAALQERARRYLSSKLVRANWPIWKCLPLVPIAPCVVS